MPPTADASLADYFCAETARIGRRPLLGITEAQDWKRQRSKLQRQLWEMLGLWPVPERNDLGARITGKVERPDFVIEKVLFESAPGLFVTGNLYRPKRVEKPLPAILYVCGHSKVEKDGLIIGNKAHYQHHPAWFAANGYVCLVIDTLQLGELPGLHHGTAREGMWWWYSRGYTPAGIEASGTAFACRSITSSLAPTWINRRSALRAAPEEVRRRGGWARSTTASRPSPSVARHHRLAESPWSMALFGGTAIACTS